MASADPSSPVSGLPEQAYGLPPDVVLEALGTDPVLGLEEREACERRERLGANELQRIPRRKAWRILLAQLRSLMAALLGVSALASAAFGRRAEALAG